MENVTHRFLELGGIRIHIAEQGSGPLVVLIHGFPSLWCSWRYQISFLADAGYHVVAADLRGFGQSDVPAEVSKYTMLHLAGDIVGLIHAMGEKQAFIVGHDWGSVVASHVALFRPDLVRGLVNLSVPFAPRNPEGDLLTELRATVGDVVYMHRWQTTEGGEAEVDFEKTGTKRALAKSYAYHSPEILQSKDGKTILDSIDLPDPLPTWLTDDYLQYCADNFNRTGFTGGLNIYRNIRSTWELTAAWTNQGINVASLFIIGDQDLCFTMYGEYLDIDTYRKAVPNLKDLIILPGVSHFFPEEAPEHVNKALLKFLSEN